MYLGSWNIDDFLTFPANTHAADTGAATDADAVPTYRIYEDETATPIVTGSMALLDGATTTGFYSERLQLTAAAGFEIQKTYTIYISAAVGGVTGTLSHTFQILAKVDTARLLSSTINDNFSNAFDTPNFQKWFDTDEKTLVSGPDFLGIVNSVPSPTATSFNALEFISADANAYVGGRITFPLNTTRVHQQCVVTGYDGAGTVTVTPIPGGAPGVGEPFHFSAARDK